MKWIVETSFPKRVASTKPVDYDIAIAIKKQMKEEWPCYRSEIKPVKEWNDNEN